MLSVKRQIVLRLGQHCCTQRVAHVWSPCSNMLLQGVVTFCSFITSYNAIQHYCKMLKCCVHLAAPLRAGFILTCHGLRTSHATGVFSSLTFESNITGYRYKCSLWIGVFVVKSYHELLLSIMEFDKLMWSLYITFLLFFFLIAIFAIVFLLSSSSLSNNKSYRTLWRRRKASLQSRENKGSLVVH